VRFHPTFDSRRPSLISFSSLQASLQLGKSAGHGGSSNSRPRIECGRSLSATAATLSSFVHSAANKRLPPRRQLPRSAEPARSGSAASSAYRRPRGESAEANLARIHLVVAHRADGLQARLHDVLLCYADASERCSGSVSRSLTSFEAEAGADLGTPSFASQGRNPVPSSSPHLFPRLHQAVYTARALVQALDPRRLHRTHPERHPPQGATRQADDHGRCR